MEYNWDQLMEMYENAPDKDQYDDFIEWADAHFNIRGTSDFSDYV